jgi:hypothetical protein
MKELLERMLPQSVTDWYKDYKNKHTAARTRKKWELEGKPLPPPHTVKQEAIRYYQQRSGYNVLVETGTYKGDMIFAQRDQFKKIYSIELSKELFKKAKIRFRKRSSVVLFQGNSGEVIAKVIAELKEPAIFWLDGHYSGGITATTEKFTPISEELQIIIRNNRLQHVILVDDARNFEGEQGYPTIKEVKDMTEKNLRDYHFSVDEDIIRLVPGKFC